MFPDGETGSERPCDLPSSPSQQVKGQRVELVYDLILSVFPLVKRHGSATWNLLFIYFWGECGFFQAQMHYIMNREHHLKYVKSRRGDWRQAPLLRSRVRASRTGKDWWKLLEGTEPPRKHCAERLTAAACSSACGRVGTLLCSE